jgi:hypothetical protein
MDEVYEVYEGKLLDRIRLRVTENETGIYLDSNHGWVVEVVHWPRSPAALKRDGARKMAHALADAWNNRAVCDRRIMALEAALRAYGIQDSLGRWHEGRCPSFGVDERWCSARCLQAHAALSEAAGLRAIQAVVNSNVGHIGPYIAIRILQLVLDALADPDEAAASIGDQMAQKEEG